MAKIRLSFIFLLCFFLNACFPQPPSPQQTFTDESRVEIYLQPMPHEASGLRFVIEKISAVRDDGLRIPLPLLINELKGADLTGFQKRLASGPLPEGSYTGIAIEINKAFLRGEEGEAALLAPGKPIEVPRLFKVPPREAMALFLSFEPSGAVTRGFRFTPDFSLAVSVKGLLNFTGYVSNSGSNTISVFNKKTMQVTGILSTGKRPAGVVFDERRARAYVAVSGDDAIEIIDVVEGNIIGKIGLNFGDEPIDLAITPDGRTLVSVNRGSNTVSIIDTASEFELRRVKVGERPLSAVVDALGLKAYIMNSLSNTISVVDLSQQTISMVIGIEGSPLRGAFNPLGDKLYVISADSPNISVIDPVSLVVTEKFFIGTGAASIKFDTRTGLILVGNKTEQAISVIDPFSSTLIDIIDTGGSAAFMAIDDEEHSLFVLLPNRKRVQKINLTSKKLVAEIEVGETAYAVVVMGER